MISLSRISTFWPWKSVPCEGKLSVQCFDLNRGAGLLLLCCIHGVGQLTNANPTNQTPIPKAALSGNRAVNSSSLNDLEWRYRNLLLPVQQDQGKKTPTSWICFQDVSPNSLNPSATCRLSSEIGPISQRRPDPSLDSYSQPLSPQCHWPNAALIPLFGAHRTGSCFW